jgi:hypothetical protein
MFSQNKTQTQKIRHNVTNFRPLTREQIIYLSNSSAQEIKYVLELYNEMFIFLNNNIDCVLSEKK